jgi:hypothetical protein
MAGPADPPSARKRAMFRAAIPRIAPISIGNSKVFHIFLFPPEWHAPLSMRASVLGDVDSRAKR